MSTGSASPEPRVIPFGDFLELLDERRRLNDIIAQLEVRLEAAEARLSAADTTEVG